MLTRATTTTCSCQPSLYLLTFFYFFFLYFWLYLGCLVTGLNLGCEKAWQFGLVLKFGAFEWMFCRSGIKREQRRLQKFCLGGSLKILNKRRTWIYQVIDKKYNNNTWSFTILFYKFSNFKCYMIVHYEYLLPMWVAMSLRPFYFVKFV